MEKVDGRKQEAVVDPGGGQAAPGTGAGGSAGAGCNLVLTSSLSWKTEAPWITELSKQTQVRCLRWGAEDPDLVPTMMADLAALGAAGISLRAALVLVSGTFPENPLGQWTPENLRGHLAAQPHLPAAGGPGGGAPAGRRRLHPAAAGHRHPPAVPEAPALLRGQGRPGRPGAGPGPAAGPGVRVVGHALGTVLPSPDGRSRPGWPPAACCSAPAPPRTWPGPCASRRTAPTSPARS